MKADAIGTVGTAVAGDSNPETYPKTLVAAIRYFSDPSIAFATFVRIRWPAGVCCPKCGSTNVLFLVKYARWKCREAHASPQFTVKIGTIMEESPLSLDKWAVAFWLEVNAKNSISSYELGRTLGITQKSAWFMLHRVRFALHQGTFDGKMTGAVEADETFIGGKARNKHKAKREHVITGTGMAGKTAVMGLLERHTEKSKSKVRTKVLADTKRKTIQPVVRENVEPGSNVCTDALASYAGLSPDYVHKFIDNAERYVNGKVDTNGLENFWSLFKRCIKGTHVSVEPFHLMAYLDSEDFKFNNRGEDDHMWFILALPGTNGKRLTYKDLTGKVALEGVPPTDKDAGNESGGLPN